jgi:hypothetical protein
VELDLAYRAVTDPGSLTVREAGSVAADIAEILRSRGVVMQHPCDVSLDKLNNELQELQEHYVLVNEFRDMVVRVRVRVEYIFRCTPPPRLSVRSQTSLFLMVPMSI